MPGRRIIDVACRGSSDATATTRLLTGASADRRRRNSRGARPVQRTNARVKSAVRVAEVQRDVDDLARRILEHPLRDVDGVRSTRPANVKPSSDRRRWSVRVLTLTVLATERRSGRPWEAAARRSAARRRHCSASLRVAFTARSGGTEAQHLDPREPGPVRKPTVRPRSAPRRGPGRSLEQRAAVELQRLDDVAQAILDRLVDPLGFESRTRGQIDDARLESESFRESAERRFPGHVLSSEPGQ